VTIDGGRPPSDAGPTGTGTLIDSTAIKGDGASKSSRAIASMFPGYEVICELGRGAMGVVYKARNRKLPDKLVAIKVLSRSGLGEIDDLNRFRGEAELVSGLAHENIVQVFDIENHQGLTYLILEYVDGGTLAERIRKDLPSPREAAEIVEKIASAIDFAHQRKIIHRDLKPANVMMTKSGIPKVTDFGLGKLLDEEEGVGVTRSGIIMGTPAYMAPEQAGGRVREFGPATDVYALGAILYELLTRRAVFLGDNLTSLLHQVENHEPVPPSYLAPLKHREKELSTLCLKCLEKNPARRFQTAGELAEELRRWLDDKPIVTRPLSRLSKAGRFVGRHPLPVALTAALLVIITLVTGGYIYVARNRAERQRNLLENQQREELARKETEFKQHFVGQFSRSLKALNAVLDQVANATGGQNSRLKGLNLHKILSEYYTNLVDANNLAYLGHDEREELTNKLIRLAELIDRVDEKDEALLVLTAAQRLLDQEQALDAPTRFRAARIAAMTGWILSRLDNQQRNAEREYLRALELLEPLPQDDRLLRLKAEANHNLGILYFDWRRDSSDLDLAEKHYLKGLEDRQQLTRPKTEAEYLKDLRDLGRSHGFLGDVYVEKGKFERADRHYWESHAKRSRIVDALDAAGKQPRVGQQFERDEARCQQARSFGNLGNLQYCRGHLRTSRDFYEKAHLAMKPLAENHPDDVYYINDFCYLTNRYAFLRLLCAEADQGGDERRLAALLALKAIEYNRDILASQPDLHSNKFVLAQSCLLLAEAQIDDSPVDARRSLDEAASRLEASSKGSKNPEVLFERARVEGLRGELAGTDRDATVQRVCALLQAALDAGALGGKPIDQVVAEYRAFKILRPKSDS
jgi:tetratricopeptide (TPR) repeat protein